ncbi:hypothetical protein [Mucilaginibacter xinganensis]|uniref:Uncharacterized protein n=1 Tax=Mucilaginibacter xinganensis TaxID=1234841 RepID=A0A223NS21_9SPHI|nr:hypothetical protein [Mucilaginibacter xinganensis]ASU32663.1 hypothetical protein MuYL_0763 [Mucilaginibacter xinganensis]
METAGQKFILFSSDSKGFKLVDDDEILANGKMYDIVKTSKANGVTSYYTCADADEDALVNKLTHVEKSNATGKLLVGKTIKIYAAKYFASGKNHQHLYFSLNLPARAPFPESAFLYDFLFKDIYAPPPDCLVS